MLEVLILVASVSISSCIGLFVFLRNPSHIINRIYGLLTLSFILFPVANYFSLHASDRLFYIRAVIISTSIAVATLYYLVYFSTNDAKKLNIIQRLGIYFALTVAALGATPLVFSGLSTDGTLTPIPNYGAAVFLLHLVIFPASSVYLLIKRLKKTVGVQKQQYIYMLIGIAPIFLFAPITSFIMPVILQNVSLVVLSPIYAAFFVAMIGYAILRHRLFDIRFYVVRAAAYLLTLLVISMLYIAPILYFVTVVAMGKSLSVYHFMTGVVIATLGALYFQAVKRNFDTVTSRIFFRDAYDSAKVLGDLNRILVTTIDLNTLLKQISEHIAISFKSEFCFFALNQTPDNSARYVGAIPKKMTATNIQKFMRLSSRKNMGLIVTDSLSENELELQSVLARNDVAAVVPLSIKLQGGDQYILGYIMLGFKKSGNPYTNQDTRTLESIGDVTVLAIQNALRFEEIQNFNITLQRRVDEATAKLRRTNAKLQALDETKDDFISMASHQLRTPLTSVKGYLSMVLDGDAGKLTPMQRKMLDQSFVSSQRMVYLIADLLNISRLKTGKFVIEPSRLNLAKLIGDEIAQLKETAKNRQLQLVYEKPADFPDLMIDETKIRQVIMNFIDNAIYYTPEGGTITVKLSSTSSNIEFRVVDTGIGVPKSEQPHLFTKFYRAGNARRARPDGTGLGLFMAKKVVVAQGGAVIFDSKEGKGSTFGFIFPMDKLALPLDTK
jgi:signal transduction histidine kinase